VLGLPRHLVWGQHCNSLRLSATHTATHYTALQVRERHLVWRHHCNSLQRPINHTATHYNILHYSDEKAGRDAWARRHLMWRQHCNSLQRTATHCNSLQHTLQHTLQHYNALQVRELGETLGLLRHLMWRQRCNSLQLTATHTATLQRMTGEGAGRGARAAAAFGLATAISGSWAGDSSAVL